MKKKTDRKQANSSRGLRLWAATHNAKREWALFVKTQNGAHAWRAYQKWRAIAPDDAPLPTVILDFLDSCAAKLEGAKTLQEIKRALQLSKAPAEMAERGGGPQGYTKADVDENNRDIVEALANEIERAHARGKTERGYKTEIYEHVAKRFDKRPEEIKVLAHDWGVNKWERQLIRETRRE